MIFRILKKRDPFLPVHIGTCLAFDNELKIYILKNKEQTAPTTELLIEPLTEDENIKLLTIKVNNIPDAPKISSVAGDNYLLKTNIIEAVRNYLGENLNPDDIELRGNN
ncbi:hypothetical protein EST62_06730 [Chlorobaculum sp. 24CR]|uniref:hypothetical protein n=1 Tax=Chlorobaculum sp. 24CR TaxID=2508878 RepID=UPI00100B7FBB|nr:hypothetical protein [Chlorobaculum sp. 24CR]RXK87560.1 hypothetical protein EST62_06730 [Chlorobaculum sp. 24CR]